MGWLSDKWDQVTNAVGDVGKVAVAVTLAPVTAAAALVSGDSVSQAIADLPGSRDEATKVGLAAAAAAGGYLYASTAVGGATASGAPAALGAGAVETGAATTATVSETGVAATAGASTATASLGSQIVTGAKTAATVASSAVAVANAADRIGGAADKAKTAAESVKVAADKASVNQDYTMIALIAFFGYAILKG